MSIKRHKAKAICPKHGVPLIASKTRHGLRWACGSPGCTVVWWSSGRTSTPADKETRTARHRAHLAFDPLWQSGPLSRNEAYRKLAEYLGLPKKKCHIGMFTIGQCVQVSAFVNQERNR